MPAKPKHLEKIELTNVSRLDNLRVFLFTKITLNEFVKLKILTLFSPAFMYKYCAFLFHLPCAQLQN